MPDVILMASLVAHAVIAAGIGWVLIRVLRWIHGQSTLVWSIVAAGLIGRVLLGLTLFWVSYLHLPILRSFQSGDGFWVLMEDARGYYGRATFAVEHGLGTVGAGGASPFYVRALAAWMDVVGVSPAAGLYLNLCLYVGVLALFVWAFRPANAWRRDLPCIVAAAAFSFSPVALIDGTQSLKDDTFTALIATMCVSAWLLLGALIYDGPGTTRRIRTVAGGTLMCGAIFCIAGIRDYYAVISWAATALVLAVFALRQAPHRLIRYASISVLILTGAWVGYAQGSGPYYRGPWLAGAAQSETRVDFPNQFVGAVDGARTSFVRTGGATNIKAPEPKAVASPTNQGLRNRARLVIVGIAIVFTPISALKALSIVEFTGGRGLLPFADLDTMFLDLSMLTILALLYARRHMLVDQLPFVVFGITLSLVTAALLGYVVTNYGTLFRLRLIVAVPIWTLALAVSDSWRERAPSGPATWQTSSAS